MSIPHLDERYSHNGSYIFNAAHILQSLCRAEGNIEEGFLDTNLEFSTEDINTARSCFR
jgi:hypothetical protein